MKKSFLLLILTWLCVTACGEQKKSAVDELKGKVMEVHDVIMPKMGDIMKYKKQLNNKIDELLEAGVDENEEEITKLKKAVGDLENSHEDMMNWMHQFNSNFDGMVEAEILEYLNDQMTKIENVATTTNTAIKNAEEILSNN